MVLNHQVDKELEKDHLVHHPYPSAGSCIYHPFPADFSLVQEHINTTGVDTYKYPTSVLYAELPPAYSRRYSPTCQLLQLSDQYPGELPHCDNEKAHIGVVQVPWQLHSKGANESWGRKQEKQTAAPQFMAWGKHKRQQMLVDLKAPLISKWPAGSKCWYLGHLSNFRLMTQTYQLPWGSIGSFPVL